MRVWWLLPISLLLPSPGLSLDAVPVTNVPETRPGTPAEHPDGLPEGRAVSQPLQPVEVPDEPPPAPAGTPDGEPAAAIPGTPAPAVHGLGDSWDSTDLLIWWPKAQPLPPLVAANRFGPAAPGATGTHLLIGGRNFDAVDQAGGRFVLGRSLNEANSLGLEGVYFFLGTRTSTATAGDSPRLGNVGFPFLDAATGSPSVLTVARPGISSARFDVSASTRLQGAEMNVVASLVDGTRVSVNGLTGYRFFQLQEGLRSEATIVAFPRPDGTPTGLAQVADQFDAHNRFNGGQVGLSLDVRRGPVFVEWAGKLAVGCNFEVVRVQGQTNTLVGAMPQMSAASYPSGIYAEPTNIGRYTRSVFAVVPETTLKVGFKLNDYGRFFAAYNFLYLSDAVRPGDQVDATLNAGQVRLLNPAGSPAGPDRPTPLVNRSDFWVQGLVLGLEGRY